MRWKGAVVGLVSLNQVYAGEQVIEPEVQPQQVTVSGKQTDIEEGRDAVAGKIIVGRERIAKSGVQNVGELLAREPAVSVGKDGRIGLLGLAGYTQILVDGVSYQRDIAEMNLNEVERIEIIKSSTASTGPIGIAGTINIIRRKVERKMSTKAQISSTQSAGKNRANVSWTSNQVSLDSPLSYNLRLSAFHDPSIRQSDYSQDRISFSDESLEHYSGQRTTSVLTRMAMASATIDWKLSAEHTLNLAPAVTYLATRDRAIETRAWESGQTLVVRSRNEAPMKAFELPLRWDWKVSRESELSVLLRQSGFNFDASAIRNDAWMDARDARREQMSASRSRNTFANLDFSSSTLEGHQIQSGIRLTRNRMHSGYRHYLDGLPDASLAMLSDQESSVMNAARAFVEDAWRINRYWSINGGVSFERRWYDAQSGTYRGAHSFDMFAPSLHVARKLGADRKKQIRLSLARTFKPPDLEEMLVRPSINAFAPCPLEQPCGPNTIDTADQVKNPSLRPERALGLNLSYTHGMGKNSELSAELYARELKGKVGSEFALENVAWADTPRYVYRPANLGNASIRGVNFEGRLSGEDLSGKWAHLDVYGSAGFAESTLADIPGPDNRIEGQSPWSFKLGGSYKNPASAFGFGVDVSLLPGSWYRHNLEQRVFASKKLSLGANARWAINKRSKLVVNLNNITSPSSTTVNEYLSAQESVLRRSRSASHARMTLRYEVDL